MNCNCRINEFDGPIYINNFINIITANYLLLLFATLRTTFTNITVVCNRVENGTKLVYATSVETERKHKGKIVKIKTE